MRFLSGVFLIIIIGSFLSVFVGCKKEKTNKLVGHWRIVRYTDSIGSADFYFLDDKMTVYREGYNPTSGLYTYDTTDYVIIDNLLGNKLKIRFSNLNFPDLAIQSEWEILKLTSDELKLLNDDKGNGKMVKEFLRVSE